MAISCTITLQKPVIPKFQRYFSATALEARHCKPLMRLLLIKNKYCTEGKTINQIRFRNYANVYYPGLIYDVQPMVGKNNMPLPVKKADTKQLRNHQTKNQRISV